VPHSIQSSSISGAAGPSTPKISPWSTERDIAHGHEIAEPP
jgi:hypothetical protein